MATHLLDGVPVVLLLFPPRTAIGRHCVTQDSGSTYDSTFPLRSACFETHEGSRTPQSNMVWIGRIALSGPEAPDRLSNLPKIV